MFYVDPGAAITGISGAIAVVSLTYAEFKRRDAEYWYRKFVRAQAARSKFESELLSHQFVAKLQQAQRISIARKGGLARQAKRAATEAAEAPARRAKTEAAIACSAFRPRDEVVADVRRDREARKQQTAGVAAAN
jgi:hypothetical protein